MASTTFYLSRILGKKIFNENAAIGKILDIIVDVSAVRPRVIAVKVKLGNRIKVIDYSEFKIEKIKNKYKATVNKIKDIQIPNENAFQLSKHIMDKQLVDIDGRKLVRVNDLRLAILSSGTYLVAVDVGIEGLLRRLDVAKPLKTILKPFGISIPGKMILWEEVETVNSSRTGIKLSKAHTKLLTLHPSDLADIIEDLDRNTQAEIFASLDEEQAADVLEELETEAAVNVLESISIEKAIDVLEKMPADEIADILDELEDEKAEELLANMENESSEEVRELMEYPENAVGSLMNTDFVNFSEDMTISEALAVLRELKPDPERIYSLYVLDKKGRFVATVSLRDLVVSELSAKLNSIMNENTVKIYDDDKIDSLAEIISKYNLLAVPVVNTDEVMVGMVVIDDVIDNLLRTKKRRAL